MTASSGRPEALRASPVATVRGSGVSQPSAAQPRPEGEPDLGKGGASGAAGKSVPGVSEPKRILVIEDEALLSMDIEASLIEAGYAVVGPAATVERARQLVAEERLDGALVDANLSGNPELEGIAAKGQAAMRDRRVTQHHARSLARAAGRPAFGEGEVPAGCRTTSHPEHPEARLLDRRVEARRQRKREHATRLGRQDDAIIP
jgi:DNA-binding NtrC family response regulator